MKKYFFLFILAAVFQLYFPHPSHSEKFNFRKTRWGMSKREVMASEQSKPKYEQENAVGYEIKLLGKDFFVIYFFTQNRLVKTRYVLNVEHTNKNDFIDDYKQLKETLTTKYGPPEIDKINWKNDLYKDDYSCWGFAISLGHLNFYSTWVTEETGITNDLYGENFSVNCIIDYTSKKLIHLREQEQHKKKMEAF